MLEIKVLELHKTDRWLSDAAFLDQAKTVLEGLEEIVWEVPQLTDTVLVKLLALSHKGEVGEYAMEEFMTHTTTLEKVIIEGIVGFEGSWINQFLKEATVLQEFHGIEVSLQFDLTLAEPAQEHQSKETGELDDHDGDVKDEDEDEVEDEDENSGKDQERCSHIRDTMFLQDQALIIPQKELTAWSCQCTLQKLSIKIGGIHRSDAVADGFRMSMFETVTKAHVEAYQLLGSLISLRELSLGHGAASRRSVVKRVPVREHPHLIEGDLVQLDGLSFSLKSELSRLAGLKELEVLDLSRMAHRVGVKELDWMHLHMPKLRTIIGLFYNFDQDEGAEDRLKAKRNWMRAHPLGIGCSYYANMLQ
ncbi:hypothetical protein BGZ83_009435 [Gryganskiella cystojenkinii]|nr:hypothetical protein BGZ83_009435 [Gryganskiella cystojenkinii]